MESLESLRGQLQSTEDLFGVVKTMKALAAVNIRQYETALESLVDYSRTIRMGLHIVLRDHPAPLTDLEPASGDPLGAVIFGTNQGLAGQFNNRIVSYALRGLERLAPAGTPRHLLAIGARAGSHLEHGGHVVDEVILAPSSLSGVTGSVQRVLFHVEDWRAQRNIERIVLFFNTPTSAAAYRSRMRWLLPIDPEWLRNVRSEPWESRRLPIYTMDWNRLLSALLHQHFFIALYRAFIESLASENASRLASMQAAEQNIEDRLAELTNRYHHLRQSAITDELLDIAAGYRAMS